ncbi:YceI family protein [Microbacterium sp.]|uniref:YceI family protein n=1 Tax=Microbacterium sp. TaxID=51671 RepID=UPI003A93CEA9
MRKRTVAVLIVAGAVAIGAAVVFGGPWLYRGAAAGSAEPAPTLTADPADASAGGPITAAEVDGTWHVADGSYAGYRVDEVLNGVHATVVGRTAEVTGDVTVSGGAVSAASITVDVATIATDQGSRDSYFRNTAMQTFRYPTATFVLTEPVAAASTPRTGAAQTVTATGDLTLAGRTRRVTVTLHAVFDGTRAQVVGSIPITFTDFGVQPPSLGFVRVADTGAVEFSLSLTPTR